MRITKSSVLLFVCFGLSLTQTAHAVSIDLVYEFDGVLAQQVYGTVDITQNGSDIDIAIDYAPNTLGSYADIHEFYFNLTRDVTGLTITADNSPNKPYTLEYDPSVAGGAGASFDWGVNFGNGGGPPGNRTLQSASFTLSADQDLSVSDFIDLSYPNNTMPVNVAAHFQSTAATTYFRSAATASGSETIGGVVPVPPAVWLFGSGLLGLIGIARRKKAA
jgi:hypothetical protein